MGKKITKAELVEEIYRNTNLPKSNISLITDNLLAEIKNALYEGYTIELRKYGTATHSGFGLGFERMIMYLTGMANIRDVIPFPRTPRNAEF